LDIALSLEKNSEHPLAQSVVQYAIAHGSSAMDAIDFSAIA